MGDSGGVGKTTILIEIWTGKNEGSIGNKTKGCSCHILAKNLSTFCPCSETLSKAEFKSNELIGGGNFKTE
jgi:hypothetical protein